MFDEFIFDLKVARRKSGLSQADCGHLTGGSHHKISQIERGQRPPTIREICTLSLIYGRNFESLFAEIFRQVRQDLADNLDTMPAAGRDWPGSVNRKKTLDALSQRLLEENPYGHVR